jgi:hypothetical protein
VDIQYDIHYPSRCVLKKDLSSVANNLTTYSFGRFQTLRTCFGKMLSQNLCYMLTEGFTQHDTITNRK